MLTDVAVKKAAPRDKPYKLYDSGGLHVVVTPTGGKLWRMRYGLAGKEKLLSFGKYPALTLAGARLARDKARDQLREGKDPSLVRRLLRARAASTDHCFEAVARAWHVRQTPGWTKRHSDDVIGSLQDDVFPVIGKLPVDEIEAPAVLSALRRIEARGALETTRRVRQRISAVFMYAIAQGMAKNDPAAVVRNALAPQKKGKQPAIVDLGEAQAMLAKTEAVPAHYSTRIALRFLALTVVRPGELRGARWDEFLDLNGPAPAWLVPAERMKMKQPHTVPLSHQAVALLKILKPITGRGPFLFPSTRHAHRPMSENALGYLLNRAGYHHRHVPHGWRSTFSTIMNERFLVDTAVIELMLAHQPENKVRSAYDRAMHMTRRRELAQIWADLLLEDAKPAEYLASGPMR